MASSSVGSPIPDTYCGGNSQSGCWPGWDRDRTFRRSRLVVDIARQLLVIILARKARDNHRSRSPKTHDRHYQVQHGTPATAEIKKYLGWAIDPITSWNVRAESCNYRRRRLETTQENQLPNVL